MELYQYPIDIEGLMIFRRAQVQTPMGKQVMRSYSNPAPVDGQSKTGLIGSHPSASPTLEIK